MFCVVALRPCDIAPSPKTDLVNSGLLDGIHGLKEFDAIAARPWSLHDPALYTNPKDLYYIVLSQFEALKCFPRPLDVPIQSVPVAYVTAVFSRVITTLIGTQRKSLSPEILPRCVSCFGFSMAADGPSLQTLVSNFIQLAPSSSMAPVTLVELQRRISNATFAEEQAHHGHPTQRSVHLEYMKQMKWFVPANALPDRGVLQGVLK